jgi:nitroimidazol reductase NimA-like FMN-containing flavoprotein (pyridoxamine 5'-phosphate oxidase superfamily)
VGLRDTLLRVSRLAEDHPDVAELDLNPIIARPDGVVAVDARVRVSATGIPTCAVYADAAPGSGATAAGSSLIWIQTLFSIGTGLLMADDMTGSTTGAGPGQGPATGAPVPKPLDEAECLRLISPSGVGRLAYVGRYGPTVLPINYVVHEGTIVFRTAHDSPTDEDLRTGIAEAEYKVAFEIDELNPAAQEGWSVLVQGSVHHVESEDELASVREAGVEPWAGGVRELFLRIRPTRITGRRISKEPPAGRDR